MAADPNRRRRLSSAAPACAAPLWGVAAVALACAVVLGVLARAPGLRLVATVIAAAASIGSALLLVAIFVERRGYR